MVNIVNIQVNFYIIFFSTEKQNFQVISTIIKIILQGESSSAFILIMKVVPSHFLFNVYFYCF